MRISSVASSANFRITDEAASFGIAGAFTAQAIPLPRYGVRSRAGSKPIAFATFRMQRSTRPACSSRTWPVTVAFPAPRQFRSRNSAGSIPTSTATLSICCSSAQWISCIPKPR